MKIKEGNICIFDPYNVLNQKEGLNDVVCVRVLKIHKKLFNKSTVDFFDIATGQLFEYVPISLLYRVDDYMDPITLIRYPQTVPVIDDTDIKLMEYCINEIKDPVVNKLLVNFKQKLEIYKLSSLFTTGG